MVMIKLAIENKIITVLSCYAPKVGLVDIIKDTFYDQLQDTVRKHRQTQTCIDTVRAVWTPNKIHPNNISSTLLRSNFSTFSTF